MRETGGSGRLPQSLEEVRGEVGYRRWRLYEAARRILAELEARIAWDSLYELDVSGDELVSWGLYLEEALPAFCRRLRAAGAEVEPAGERADPDPAALDDHLHWGTRQIESGLQQALSVLSRELVSRLTAPPGESDADDEHGKRALVMPIAEVAGKLSHDLRKLTAFLVAGERWSPDAIELLLFPARRADLERSRVLKTRLVETMESFQGSEDRLPIADVLQLWRDGRALGQAALAEVDSLIRGLLSMLEPANRRALYVDSFHRLRDWSRHLARCSEGLERHLGDEVVEDALIKEIAAILDTELLAEIVGRRQVDRLRSREPLPESMAHLEHLHPLVLAAQDGLRTYLTLLYGQIQNRDLHLLVEDRREVPLAEKRLAVAELDYRLSRLRHAASYFAFEAVRHRLRGRQPVPAQEWTGLRRFLDHLRQVVAPRLARIAVYEEIAGIPDDAAARMEAACASLAAFEEPPGEERLAEVEARASALAALLEELGDVRVEIAAPQTVEEIEDFLDMMG